MTAAVGDVLVWLAAGLLFPLTLLPLASLAGGRVKSALIFLALVAAIPAASILFAHLAVDIDPPAPTSALLITAGISIAGLAALAAVGGASALVARLSPAVEAIVRTVGRVSILLILVMAALQFAAVILRYVFGLNFIALQESVTYLHGAVFLLAGGYALLTDDHVRVDIFYRGASPRRKAFVDLAGTYLFLLPFCFVALWAAAPYVANSWAVREGSVEQSGIKGVYLLKTLIPIYLTLLALAGFVVASRAAAVLKRGPG
jgi:TRAP-type mannitol/chloroaromatic compound transport system permease small subunit